MRCGAGIVYFLFVDMGVIIVFVYSQLGILLCLDNSTLGKALSAPGRFISWQARLFQSRSLLDLVTCHQPQIKLYISIAQYPISVGPSRTTGSPSSIPYRPHDIDNIASTQDPRPVNTSITVRRTKEEPEIAGRCGV